MNHGNLAQFAAVVGATGTVLLLATSRRATLAAGMALLGLAEVLLVVALVPSHDLERARTPAGAAALAFALVTIVVLAWVFARRPELALPAMLVAAPFRVPIQLGDQKAFLLVPLYGIVASAALGFLYRWLRGTEIRPLPVVIAYPAAAFSALYAVSLLWSQDLRQGSIELVFFLFPFAVGMAVAARAPLPAWLPRALGTILVALAAGFALVGIWQRATHTIFFAQDLRVANAYTSYFRVTSVFKDPSLFGRSLVLGLAVIVVALWLNRIGPVLAFALSALLWAGLYFSYSQSSMVTLVVVTIAVTLIAGDRTARITIAAAAGLALIAASVGIGIYAANHPSAPVTSGRSRLVSVTTRVIADHPLVGVGVGAQPKASHEEATRRGLDSRDASHTTPLTVAAELGALGVLVYLAFLAGAVRILWDAYVRDRALGLGLAAIFLTLFVHSLVYAGFFEDPVTWGCLAVAAAVVAALPAPVREIAGIRPTPAEAPAR
jgi:hypothetical protein